MHLRERFLGWHAAIHAPHASRFAVLALDASEESLQRDGLGGVTRESGAGYATGKVLGCVAAIEAGRLR